MKCVHFQLQSSNPQKVKELLQKVDPRAPLPEALEGGDGKGGLWECILDANKVDMLVESLQENIVYLYTEIYSIKKEVDPALYLPSNRVSWQFGGDPIIEKLEVLDKKERTDSCVIS